MGRLIILEVYVGYTLLTNEGKTNEPLGAEAPPLVGGGGSRKGVGVSTIYRKHNIYTVLSRKLKNKSSKKCHLSLQGQS